LKVLALCLLAGWVEPSDGEQLSNGLWRVQKGTLSVQGDFWT
jgi:hypothetical protein